MFKEDGQNRFWHIRSTHYDKLFWVKDKSYLDSIIELSGLNKSHVVLDVGSGTGAVAKEVKKAVKHVVAMDISHSMLNKGEWEGTSVIKWDIGEALFVDGIFDRVLARMVFHHIMDNIDRAVLRCYDVLKPKGKIVVAEGIPPTDEDEIVDWYTEMFRYKEERRTFRSGDIQRFLKKNGFRNVKTHVHVMENFNVNNWLKNSGLNKKIQKKIYDIHVKSDKKIKDVYDMRVIKGECIIRTMNVIVVGQK
tara:strand:- start:5930 stop:6676 length:747 start_codon:yes stop_codon:yes gene_type:complete